LTHKKRENFETEMYKLFLKIRDKEQLPTQWNEGTICPMYKKGD
jgi:hypothetical protein